MRLGKNLAAARKKSGLSQEYVAEKLGVSRQTISNWELDETLPDIRQSKKLSSIYKLSLDELIDFDEDENELQEMIDRISDEKQSKVDWNKVWGKKYPILLLYKEQVSTKEYKQVLRNLLDKLKDEYGYNELDSMLVLKDILATVWKESSKK